MTDNSDHDTKRPLSLGRPSGSRLELRKPIETGQVRQSFPHGRSKTVQVEVRRKRATPPGQAERPDAPPPSEAAKSAAAAT
ncbi:MAG TPA: translation initiation factor IF-2 associated domain-containing protein, partial [Stellaceae bacterium]|nr:translation initiation factor IF-2 associated domain-containing protein [Stellaceae bacterium]